jgi:alpha-1,2-mannosyltransferase
VIVDLFRKAKVAIHTMKAEHFGISCVEMMSAGLVTIAHDSAGPRMDIIGRSPEPVGHLADTAEEYAALVKAALLKYSETEYEEMRCNAKNWVTFNFSAATFDKRFVEMVQRC